MKIAIALVMALAGVVAFYLLSEQILVVRLVALLALVGVGVVIYARSASGARALAYVGEARTEVRKVVWPTRAETVQTSIAVFVMVLVLGLILFFVDKILFWGVRLITGQGG